MYWSVDENLHAPFNSGIFIPGQQSQTGRSGEEKYFAPANNWTTLVRSKIGQFAGWYKLSISII